MLHHHLRVHTLLLVVSTFALLGAGRLAEAQPKYVIFHQWGGIPVADAIRYRAQLESMPFDGMTVTIPASGTLMLGTPVSYDEMRRQLAPMKGAFRKFTQNFVVVHTRRPPDVFDDWSVMIRNWRNLARAAREAGLTGIFFDNEEYKEKTWTFPRDIRYSPRGLSAYHDQMRLRGRQVMQAVSAEFPQAVVLTFHGPYISDPRTPNSVTRSQCGARSEDLRGFFFVGMVEGAGPGTTMVDGGECYQYRSVEDFEGSYRWRKHDVAQGSVVSPGLRATWPQRVNIAFAVYNKQWLAWAPMNPSIMRTTLANAVRRADKYVWFYEEGEWAQKGMPGDWFVAIRDGIAAGRGRAAAPGRATVERRPAPKPRGTAKRPAARQSADKAAEALIEQIRQELKSQLGVDIDRLQEP